MKPFFPIAPWEFPGASFEPAPHAVVRHEVGGKKRTFWLKMRDGVIYFRESARVPVFAVSRLFDSELVSDPERLIAAWKEEVSRDNYGAFIISHRKWPRTLAAANYCIILRENGSGWIKEHFDEKWLEFSISSSYPFPIWHHKFARGETAEAIINQTRSHFLGRRVDASHFQTISPHWSSSHDEMVDVLRSAAQLWLTPDDLKYVSKRHIEWRCRSNSSFLAGSVTCGIGGSSYRFNQVWDMVTWHYGFVGVEWKKASDHPELQAKYGPEVWKRGFEKWGEEWRGNWIGSQYESQTSTPPLARVLSQHDRLEAAMTLREFLRDKMPAEKVDALLNDALKSG